MKEISFSYTRERLFSGFDGTYCKVCPTIAYDGEKTAFLTYQMLLLSGSDVFFDTYISKSTDGGKTFGEPKLRKDISWTENGIRMAPLGWVLYNNHHKKWFGLGEMTKYENDDEQVLHNDIGECDPLVFSFDEETGDWADCYPMEFPFDYISARPAPQHIELDNGDILVAFYYQTEEMQKCGIITAQYTFQGDELKLVKAGEPISGENFGARGFCEPSLAYLNGKYYLTIRSDDIGVMAVSEDGFTFSEPTPWKWDDGSILENYNTMQHWVRNKDGLFLAYTRRGAHNDHVFRHRAPIFMARFDEDRNCLVRASEVILVPELGTRLGNFNVIEAGEKESWLITAEWMQPIGCEKYGSDNSLWIARVFWE